MYGQAHQAYQSPQKIDCFQSVMEDTAKDDKYMIFQQGSLPNSDSLVWTSSPNISMPKKN